MAASDSTMTFFPFQRRNTAEDTRSATLIALSTARTARLTSPLILNEVLERLLIVGVADPGIIPTYSSPSFILVVILTFHYDILTICLFSRLCQDSNRLCVMWNV
jgi:hypothetical protein